MEAQNLWEIEDSFHDKGFQVICGVDEAGRGPLAGPVCAAAVILPRDLNLPGLNDSKKLSDKKRRILYDQIRREALAYGIAFATQEEIDEINILQATYLAMERAIAQFSKKPDLALIDGNRAKNFGLPVETIVKGDAKCASIAAASILAKVTRDDYMIEVSKTYPDYGFEIHKGYGTKVHYQALDQHGLCPLHRRTFLKNYVKG